MKSNEKLGLCLMDENNFISFLFTLTGEPEASICRVIKAEASRRGIASAFGSARI